MEAHHELNMLEDNEEPPPTSSMSNSNNNTTSSSSNNSSAEANEAEITTTCSEECDLDDSGYSTSPEEMQTTTEDSTTSDSSVSLGGYKLFDEEDDDEDVIEKIYFLREKQQILERATCVLNRKLEDCLCAATATKLFKLASSSSNSQSNNISESSEEEASIYNEAKCVLKEMGDLSLPGPPRPRKRCAPNPVDPQINMTAVQIVTSKKYGSEERNNDSSNASDKDIVTNLASSTMFGEDQWLMKALLWNNDSGNQAPKQSDHGRWKMVSDPFAFSFGLLPPTNMSLQHAVDLQDVINVSDEARIVTQATPPFCVVHVNRAFLELADLPGHDTLTGRPVESMFQVTRASVAIVDSSNSINNNEKRFLNGKILIGRQKDCRLQVLPVVDRSRRRRTHPHARGAGRNHCFCMSHVLIQVVEPLSNEHQSYLSIEDPVSSDAASCGSQTSSSTPSDNIVGTVG